MKRFTILMITIVASTIAAVGQHKVRVIDKNEGYPLTVYVWVDNDEITRYGVQVENFQVGHYDDIVYLEMTREECERMRSALRKTRTQLRGWTTKATIHNVRNYAKSLDVYLPPVSILWTTTEEISRGQEGDIKHQADSVALHPCFYVRDGNAFAACWFFPEGTNRPGNSIRLFLTPYNLNNLIRCCNTKRIDRLYREKHPSAKERARYDNIFK